MTTRGRNFPPRPGFAGHMRRAFRIAVLVSLLGSLAAPANGAVDESFSPDGVDLFFAAGGGRILSTFDDPAGRTRLQEGFGPGAKALGVRPVSTRVGIDIGTDAAGRAAAVYGRCPRGRRCDLYAFNFAERRERQLGVSRRACSEVGPRIDRGVVVFQRFLRRSAKRSLRCRRGLFEKRPGQRLRLLARRAPDDYDLEGDLLAFQRTLTPATGDLDDEQNLDEIRVVPTAGGRSRLIARAEGVVRNDDGAFEGTFLSNLRLSGGFVHWIRSVEDFTTGDRITTADVLHASVRGDGPSTTLDRDGRLYTDDRANGGDQLFGLAVDGDRLLYEFPRGIGEVGTKPPPFR